MTNESQTLSERLAEGRLPISDALRLAVELANALRHVHDEGRVQGMLTPDTIRLTGSNLELIQADYCAAEAPTPYTAPELLHEHGPDVTSDIFAFGAIVYELLTGRRAFGGNTPEALAESIANSVPAPIGLGAFDRLVSTCLSKDPRMRWQRMQHVCGETRLAATMVRAERGAAVRHQQMDALRAEVEQLESRLASRLEQYEGAIADLHRGFADMAAGQQKASLDAVSEALQTVRVQFDESSRQIGAATERSIRAEQVAEHALGEVAGLREEVSGELHVLEDKIGVQAGAIESGRIGIARTDDLVERVVEALEVLQGMVLEQSEDRAAPAGS